MAQGLPLGAFINNADGYKYVITPSGPKKTFLLSSFLPKCKGTFSIGIGEVCSRNTLKKLQVTKDFLAVLRRKPTSLFSTYGNAYRFGPLFKSYYNFDYHGNDAAQTGILLLTGLTKAEKERIDDYDLWSHVFPKYAWTDRTCLVTARRVISDKILFVGETIGGDVGANIYVHLNASSEIDGLIIDNNCVVAVEE